MSVFVDIATRRMPAPMTFSVSTDILQPCDTLYVEYPDEAVIGIRLDSVITMSIDRARVFTGRIDEFTHTGSRTVGIRARDNIGRVVDESVPGVGWRIIGASLRDEILKIVYPWFSKVEFSNTTDRDLRRGGSRRRGVVSGNREPITPSQSRSIGMYIDAGVTRWAALQQIIEPLGLLAWSSGDGSSLIVAKPNYSQRVQYRFSSGNVIDASYTRSIVDRYQTVVVAGSARSWHERRKVAFPVGVKPKKYVSKSTGIVVSNSPDFQADKRLFVNKSSLQSRDAQASAERIAAQQSAKGEQLELVVSGHGQNITKGSTVLYAIDTLASVDIKAASGGVIADGVFYVTRTDTVGNSDGTTTRISLVRKGVALV